MGTQPFVILRIKDLWFALPATIIHEMVAAPEISQVPTIRKYVRGVINLRQQVLPVIDLRRVLGFASRHDEVAERINMLKMREQEHVDWIATLEESVRHGGQFNLALDHHSCTFGRWYQGYRTRNLSITNQLAKIDAPHQEIHAIGRPVIALIEQGKQEEALKILAATRADQLHQLQNLFAELYLMLSKSNREIAIIIEHSSTKMALLVDEIHSVRALGECQQIDESMVLTTELPIIAGHVIEEGWMIALLNLDHEDMFAALLAA